MKTYAIILASGSSVRFGDKIPKQYLKIKDKTILEHTITAFENSPKITDIIVVTNPEYFEFTKKLLTDNFAKLKKIITGGATRQESSYCGVFEVMENDAKVLIHDAARPFVTEKIIADCVDGLDKYDALAVAIPSTDTIIETDENGFIKSIPQRATLRRIQTPQAFKSYIIKKAHELAKNEKSLIVTDDCGMVLHYNLAKIAIINGDERNIKITHKNDLK